MVHVKFKMSLYLLWRSQGICSWLSEHNFGQQLLNIKTLWCGVIVVIDMYFELGYPDIKVRGANMGPIRGRKDPGGPHVDPMNIAVWVLTLLPTLCVGLIPMAAFDAK